MTFELNSSLDDGGAGGDGGSASDGCSASGSEKFFFFLILSKWAVRSRVGGYGDTHFLPLYDIGMVGARIRHSLRESCRTESAAQRTRQPELSVYGGPTPPPANQLSFHQIGQAVFDLEISVCTIW